MAVTRTGEPSRTASVSRLRLMISAARRDSRAHWRAARIGRARGSGPPRGG